MRLRTTNVASLENCSEARQIDKGLNVVIEGKEGLQWTIHL